MYTEIGQNQKPPIQSVRKAAQTSREVRKNSEHIYRRKSSFTNSHELVGGVLGHLGSVSKGSMILIDVNAFRLIEKLFLATKKL